jgi:quinol monooxygenase YgiN
MMAMPDPSRLIIARVHGVSAREAELIAAAEELARAGREQDGCLAFDVLARPGVRSELVLVSAWASEGALRAHYASDAYASFSAAVTDLLTRPSDVTIHAVSATVHPIPDLSTEPRRAS